VGRKNRAERRARVGERRGRGPTTRDDGGSGGECGRCGWQHDASAPCLFEDESPEIEAFAFGCRGERYAHGLPVRDLEGVGAAKELLRAVLAKGREALLPCGTCRAGEVFPVLFERGLCY